MTQTCSKGSILAFASVNVNKTVHVSGPADVGSPVKVTRLADIGIPVHVTRPVHVNKTVHANSPVHVTRPADADGPANVAILCQKSCRQRRHWNAGIGFPEAGEA